MNSDKQNILNVKSLNIRFNGPQPFHAVQDISFDIAAGETLALIGQSGSGKSLTSLALMGLLPKNATLSGEIFLNNTENNLAEMPAEQWFKLRGKEIGMIFQEPMTALNPVKTCGYQLMESMKVHQDLSTKELKEKAIAWFEKVKLPNPKELLKRYPHQLSGGQKQRVMIAMAMCNHPALLIADEPTTALDVTVQKEVVELMIALQKEFNTALLFITHDIALAKTITQKFLVLEKGKIVARFPQVQEKHFEPYIKVDKELPILKVENVEVVYPQKSNWLGKTIQSLKAVDKVSFEIYKGETIGLVGESGCGKSTLSKTILGLQTPTSGNILFENQIINQFSTKEWRVLRRDIQIIFQDPYASLNQRMKIGDALAEPMLIHQLASKKNVDKLVEQLLEMVQLPVSAAQKYPHEFSGGQRQRICIARALAVQPKFIICDESVAALDVHIQEQILDLLAKLQKEKDLTYLFITHDLKVVERISNRILVMQSGKIVEQGPTEKVINNPQQVYTCQLLAAVPK